MRQSSWKEKKKDQAIQAEKTTTAFEEREKEKEKKRGSLWDRRTYGKNGAAREI